MGKPSNHKEEEIPLTRSVSEEGQPVPEKPPKEVSGSDTVQSVESILSGAPEMPEVQQHAIDAAKERLAEQNKVEESAQTTGQPQKGKTDDRGRSFDPDIHEHDGGVPRINSKGFIKCRRGGAAKPGHTGGPSQSRATDPTAPKTGPDRKTEQAEALQAKIEGTAQVSAMMVITLGQMIGGEEFAPKSGESEGLSGAFKAYYTARGIVDMPPEVMLAVALAGYVVPRWYQPIFAAKRAKWWLWLKSKMGGNKDKGGPVAPVVKNPDSVKAA